MADDDWFQFFVFGPQFDFFIRYKQPLHGRFPVAHGNDNVTRLGKFVDRKAGQLSGGMYKKLGLMCAMLQSPRVLILDEPTNGVDPISRREFWDLLYSLAEEKILIIIATAYMDEAERCHEVHLMDEGTLMDSGEPRELLKKANARSFDEIYLKRAGE